MKRGYCLQSTGPIMGCRENRSLGICDVHHGMFSERTKGKEREELECTGEEQAWENKG